MSRWPAVAMLLLALASGGAHGAETPESLIAAGELRVDIVVDTPAPLYQRTPIILAVEVATPRWFSRGTRVRDFRIPGAIVLPVSSFASNQTRRIDGATWTVQRWRFRVYAQGAGELALPALRVFVSVNHAGEAVEGELILRHAPLQVVAPPVTPDDNGWLAASAFRVEEQWEGLRDEYRVGDAITRTRRFLVADAPGMMIPAVEMPGISGLSLYTAPARVQDASNRGQLRGVREEKLVITIEAAGDYTLPASSYAWLDSESLEMHSETLPAFSFSAATAATEPAAGPGPAIDRRQVLAAALLLLIAGGAFTLLRRFPWSRLLAPLRRARQYLRLRGDYHRALRTGDAATAAQILHRAQSQATLTAALRDDTDAAALLRQLLANAYGGADRDAMSLTRADGTKLWRAVHRRSRAGRKTPVLSLNPGPGQG